MKYKSINYKMKIMQYYGKLLITGFTFLIKKKFKFFAIYQNI